MADLDAIAEAVSGHAHAPTQVTDRGVDLRVAVGYDHDDPPPGGRRRRRARGRRDVAQADPTPRARVTGRERYRGADRDAPDMDPTPDGRAD